MIVQPTKVRKHRALEGHSAKVMTRKCSCRNLGSSSAPQVSILAHPQHRLLNFWSQLSPFCWLMTLSIQVSGTMGTSGPLVAVDAIVDEQRLSSFADVIIGVMLLFYLMISKLFRTD